MQSAPDRRSDYRRAGSGISGVRTILFQSRWSAVPLHYLPMLPTLALGHSEPYTLHHRQWIPQIFMACRINYKVNYRRETSRRSYLANRARCRILSGCFVSFTNADRVIRLCRWHRYRTHASLSFALRLIHTPPYHLTPIPLALSHDIISSF